ncbi:hypothetical protein B9Z19DRAFT_1126368 [Tuber borchii]|uniref:Uncharacterized protein n=1 Tax=Tuber borchii TaxID=42251 RepID=A0A2T6ZT56_TUBBO|nr:hypothetical protein B9Z19DRAFT_1126368 [Tuber borchii]
MVWQEVMEQLFKDNQPNISLSVPVKSSYTRVNNHYCIFSQTSQQEVSQAVKLFTDNQYTDGILIVTEGRTRVEVYGYLGPYHKPVVTSR